MTKTTRSNGVATDYTYDTEGKIEQIQHGTLGTIGFNFDAANQPAAITDTGFPVDGGTFLTSASVETRTFDDANQIISGGYAYDDRGRPTTDGTRTFTWDSADRLIGVVNGGSTLAYDYLADGRIASRTLNGQTTDYSYADSVATRPILAERKAAAFTRFYIALPDGRLLYQIDLTPTPAVRFYHFGKVGETRFLTDAAGAVTDAYAYDGHGRLLGKTGTSDQIHAFTGELGVRHDPEAGLVHMRARHYDPVSGRFLSRDPIHLTLMGQNGQHANPYHFVEGMTTWVTDPSGLDAEEEFSTPFRDFGASLDRFIEGINNPDFSEDSDPEGSLSAVLFRHALIISAALKNDPNALKNLEFLQMVGFSETAERADPNLVAKFRASAEFNKNKAAVKALIRRELGGFFHLFVPLGGQEKEEFFLDESGVDTDFSNPSGDPGPDDIYNDGDR
jgi:RHS repeat-associated protein